MLGRLNFSAVLLAIGFVLALFQKFEALEMSRYSMYVVMALVFLNILTFKIDPTRLRSRGAEFWKREAVVFSKAVFASMFLQTMLLAVFARAVGFDEKVQVGVIVASCCPFALVAPQFCRSLGWSGDRSAVYVILSHVFFPLFLAANLVLLNLSGSFVAWTTLIQDIFFFTMLPAIAAFALGIIFQTAAKHVSVAPRFWTGSHRDRFIGIFNMMAIGFICYTSTGAFLSRVNWTQLRFAIGYFGDATGLVLGLILIGLLASLQDFGSVWLGRRLGIPEDLVLTTSVKNVAIGCAMCLVYFPKGALPSLAVLLIHSVFFTFYRTIFHRDRL